MSEKIMELITWLGALGIPSIFAMTVWCIRCCLQYTRQLKVLAKAQQAQMRSQLLEQYHFYMYYVFVGTNPGIWGLGIRERIVVTAKCYILDQGRTTAAAAEDSAQPG